MKRLVVSFTNILSHHLRLDARYFFSGGVWLSFIQAIVVFGALIVSVVLANTLSEADFGIYKYLIGIGALLTSLSLTGMTQSIFQTAKNHPGFYSFGIKKSLVFGAGVSLSALAGSFYYFYQDNHTLALGFLLIAIFQPLLNTYQQIFLYLQGRQKYRLSTTAQAIKTIIVTLACVISVYFSHNIILLLFLYFASNTVCNYLIHIIYSPKNTADIEIGIINKYYSYAQSLSWQNIISNIAYRLDAIVVFQLLGATQLAIYSLAIIVPEHIKASFKNIVALLIPRYAQHENLDSIAKSLIKRSLQMLFVFTLIMIAYIAVAPYIYQLLFPEYNEAVIISQILALSFPAMIALIPISALQAHTKKKSLSRINTSTSILLILLTLALTYTHGIYGTVFAKVLLRYINLLLSYYYFYKSR